MAAHAWTCGLAFGHVAEGDVKAEVTPGRLYLELRSGGCDGGGTLLGTSATGTLQMKLRAGRYHVRVGNPTDQDAAYALAVGHLFPSV